MTVDGRLTVPLINNNKIQLNEIGVHANQNAVKYAKAIKIPALIGLITISKHNTAVLKKTIFFLQSKMNWHKLCECCCIPTGVRRKKKIFSDKLIAAFTRVALTIFHK